MTDKPTQPVGYALIGAGAFGRWCLDKFAGLESVRRVAVCDLDGDMARGAAKPHGLTAYANPAELLEREDVDIVHIATPPKTHGTIAEQCIRAGKHVLCEKPMATRLEEAERIAELARSKKRVLAANLVMRYDPLSEAVQQILEQKLLGDPIHGFFENYAKDEPLPEGHWFWDKSQSGGIFIEHSVHFFDLFAYWLGDGKVVAAQESQRPGVKSPLVEQVQCTLRYEPGVLVNFYHGFTQAARMDRQEMRIVCERGDIRLYEWTPLSLAIDCLADEATIDRLHAILHTADIGRAFTYEGDVRNVTSRGKRYEVDGRYSITAHAGMTKDELYGHMACELLNDQVQAIRDPQHVRRVDERNGVESLRQAVDAEQLATA